jgi:hypothetical protein
MIANRKSAAASSTPTPDSGVRLKPVFAALVIANCKMSSTGTFRYVVVFTTGELVGTGRRELDPYTHTTEVASMLQRVDPVASTSLWLVIAPLVRRR